MSLENILSQIPIFFFGMVTGMVLLTATFVFLFIRSKVIDVEKVTRPTSEVDPDVLIELVKSKQKEFKQKRKLKEESVSKLTFNLSFELVNEIAKYFFPDSKYPTLELSVNELLNLNHYITDRIDEILDKPVIKNTKKMQIVKVMEMLDKKRAVQETRVVKAAKKMKLGKIAKFGGMALNAVNPVYWFRKAVISTSVSAMTKKICIVIIGIVGEETIKVYSKALFDEPVDIKLVENEMQALLEEPDEDEEDSIK